ncbi:serine hydrolase domain-containing protein [Desulfuribacillus alkaliarsenatis]|uniref:Beta-lactamase-related domain-containing protein n=1 Tax=Desulfuribacillus alkaliarsenatis TaxID=766136 RepID=A0A1E5FZ19_9FIRM|nr:serine hydrolase domain-containing protein [Desulfuribacillus alkaliarsenatis]OEF95687.1 hypothetical protein BHF68_11310 [Desulfuribacillus alkaliarsenatis]
MLKVKKVMVRMLLIGLVLIFLQASSAVAESINKDDITVYLDEIIKAQIEEHNIPNSTVAVVIDGQVAFMKGYGYSDLDDLKAVDPANTIFRVGSTSKVFTWTAVMQLVEQGKIDLKADVNTYLDFKLNTSSVTMEHLLSHTAGFEDTITDLFAISEHHFLSLEEYLKKHVPAHIYPAGEVIAYSNYGTTLAGYIVERVSGMSFEQYVDEHILAPLGMGKSTFEQPLPVHLAPFMTKGYRYIDGEFVEGSFELMPAPAGGLSTTAADMAQFMLAHLQADDRILQPETYKQMHRQLYSQHPYVDGIAHGFIEQRVNGQRALAHGGSTMLFDSGMYLIPEQNIGIFYAYSGGNYLLHVELFQAFMDQYFPVDNMVVQESLIGAKERAKQYVGEYHPNRRNISTDEKILALVMGPMTVKADVDGSLLVSNMMETNRFVEIEPGIYRNTREGMSMDPYGQFRTIVFDTTPYGELLLVTDGVMSYTKAAWNETTVFTLGTILISIMILIGSLIYWVAAFIVRKVKGNNTQETTRLAVIGRLVAIAFAVLVLAFLLSFLAGSEMDPVYQLPVSAFDPAPTSLLDLIRPIMLVVIGIALIGFMVLIWFKKQGSLGARIHYTVFTGAAILLIWVLNNWNLL